MTSRRQFLKLALSPLLLTSLPVYGKTASGQLLPDVSRPGLYLCLGARGSGRSTLVNYWQRMSRGSVSIGSHFNTDLTRKLLDLNNEFDNHTFILNDPGHRQHPYLREWALKHGKSVIAVDYGGYRHLRDDQYNEIWRITGPGLLSTLQGHLYHFYPNPLKGLTH